MTFWTASALVWATVQFVVSILAIRHARKLEAELRVELAKRERMLWEIAAVAREAIEFQAMNRITTLYVCSRIKLAMEEE